ncbi:permease-like cell division protein FtsX [Clostridium estertheticum]|uniref:Cell division protein FtsX n=1 Tax=Clostridium estertheticum subsp. estertheticum TaxID=1552 RepID=A0A1J0GMN0_9CLOT|nr:permease-like cell division protein FtsX [Clostridium estertheticum]APC42176.1 cell division protein FtsX [Clostridium estertheticum subsp. estertheticum]MBU3073738.1 permease-like cell division protein FtsX [Clostridium estertheticum]MBU3163831.1 permease-like cell division protein FtsX [Clostridium estertheticum]MBU3172350.1 permease-like cell division protein FtsX [Clostridium estertheticum]MBU3184197.1 permease-like cell division protein FtsX [Clostridium estertheticum]
MKISTIKYFIMDALKSLKRNKTVSIASVATVAATLFILGVFLLIVFNVNAGVKELGAKLQATVYLKDNITIADKSAIERTLNGVAGVSSITFEDKNDALNNAKKQFGKENESLTKGLEKIFPTSYVVKVEKPEMVSSVVKAVTGLKGIEKINDGRETVDKIIKITNTLKIVGIVLFAILVSVSLFLIGNTIKLTVYSRKKEIGIMKFVGATDWFIRWPFIIEGMLLGISGAIISTGVLYYAYKLVFEKVTSGVLGITLINPYIILSTTLWQFMLGGLIIGALGSSISIRKFLIV